MSLILYDRVRVISLDGLLKRRIEMVGVVEIWQHLLGKVGYVTYVSPYFKGVNVKFPNDPQEYGIHETDLEKVEEGEHG